jgi:uncharacterized protein (DUF2236 family)
VSDSLFAADSVVRQVDGERVLLLGGPRALLMQLAHPMVARGVAEHSGFAADPFARLRRTLDATYSIVFGTEETARKSAAAVRAVHERVRGEGYDANDPALLLWVHATLVDTALRVHRRFLGGLSDEDAGRYYEESTVVADLLGVPRDQQPADLAAFRVYVRGMVATLEVGDDARRLARAVLSPRLPLPLVPLARLGRDLTAGLLPESLRRQYGLSWTPLQAAALEAVSTASRLVLPRLPAVMRRSSA